MIPAGVILATLFVPVLDSVNHMLPSGPRVIANGPALAVGVGYSRIVPLGGRVFEGKGDVPLDPPPHAVRVSTRAVAANLIVAPFAAELPIAADGTPQAPLA
jgi:hypothetical protein